MLETTVPFSGFYETIHSDNLQRLAEDEAGDWSEEINNSINWKEKEKAYARAYCQLFSDEIGIPLEYVDMESPKEYNFRTDRIFAKISEADVERLKGMVEPDEIREYVRKHFTSRDGFMSFYDSNYDNWLTQKEPWDHNQIGALLDCLFERADHNPEWGLASDIEVYSL